MEHLALPRDPIRAHPEIRMVTTEFRDDGPFLDFPERHSDLLEGSHPHVPTQADALAGRFTAGISNRDILNYYQGWLYFNLLAEFLGPLYRLQNYLDVTLADDGSGEIKNLTLTTARLHADIALWREQGPLGQIRPGDAYHQHLDECLDLAFGALGYLSNFPEFAENHPEEVICFASLAETFDISIATALERERPAWLYASPKRSWLSKVYSLVNFRNAEQRGRMLEAGWCPGDMARVDDSFNTIAAYYYFGNFKPEKTNPNLHKDCPAYGCTLSTLAEPKHMTADCRCPGMIRLSEEDLIRIYEEDCIPCFSLGRLEDGALAVALSSISTKPEDLNDPNNRYVALSHVWSEGLGNPGANELPLCQLAFIQHEAMRALQAVQTRDEDSPEPSGTGITVSSSTRTQSVNLWVDTMCCPATPGYGKNLCLAKMRDIYANAYAVLVRTTALDGLSLEPIVTQPELGIMDVAAQLYLSPWMRRMWTLQEGVLAGLYRSPHGTGDRLILDFDGALMSLESVVGLLKKAPPHEGPLAFDMIGRLGQLAPHLYGLEEEDGAGMFTFLEVLSHALKYRGVSVQSDELICLATLFGLRVDKSRTAVPLIGDGQTPEEGMCELWKRIEKLNSGIPSNIIFSAIPRASKPGFRWAPRTIIQHGKYGPLYATSSSPELGRITERGLRVRFQGLMLNIDSSEIYRQDFSQWAETDTKDIDPRTFSRTLLVQIPPGGNEWYSIVARPSGEVDGDTEHEEPNLHQRLRAGERLVLLLQQPHLRGQGLIVSLGDETTALNSTFPVQVFTIVPAMINQFKESAAFVAASAQECLNKLNSSLGTGQGIVMDQVRLTAAAMLKESKELESAMYVEVLRGKSSATEEDLLATFVKYVGTQARCGGVDGTVTVPDQLWCVD
ncbi:hypothetical protein QBC47DRAFT_184865 [Echria macrotheca]|uniref:Heterokaryon incompatibility domain-containing protein n=1 Tax=Echria macrotheca TaxID=438768 RepID=A0AAJ0BDN2_9PEZI|nr:hypothetical protein QBC47DRAFT_184865 [Echria macrotheca]